jgi:uncharacterized protein (TIGR02058 family)
MRDSVTQGIRFSAGQRQCPRVLAAGVDRRLARANASARRRETGLVRAGTALNTGGVNACSTSFPVKTGKKKAHSMTMKRMAVEIGMGTDIRGADYTKAAVRALRDALWHNSLTVADAVGQPVDAMVVEVLIGVPKPERVDTAEVLKVLPHGTGTVRVCEGGLEIFNDAGTGSTVLAHAAAIVRLNV